ncbi:MAG: hypothetical protein Q4A17_14155 [Thermoguttaceae bacterium]|nr:hypothetical protein [Thermoguttaceae bacterium]
MAKKTKPLEFVLTQDLGELAQKIAGTIEDNDYDTEMDSSFDGNYNIEVSRKSGMKFFGLAEEYKIMLKQENGKGKLRISDDWFGTNWLFIVGGCIIWIPFLTGLIGFTGREKKKKKVFNLAASCIKATQNSAKPPLR